MPKNFKFCTFFFLDIKNYNFCKEIIEFKEYPEASGESSQNEKGQNS